MEDRDGKIIPRDIEEEMKTAYISYAMSVIVQRALPDVRDGLKPVHRRILYAMYEDGITSDKPYRKCANTVGSVLGRYHPHGDASVYDAMVRMAQDFSMRYCLVDGHGNFGSIDGDGAAAMRYTEARMSKIAENMLTDIEKNTVDFMPNYDDRLQEPTVLPTRIPTLLINGSNGIAVGMATNIPPHNITEVIDGIIKIIDDDNVSDEEAAFTVIGSIGLEGIRLLKPELGETIVVIGLGLIGLIVSQLLVSNGCKVIGVDFDQQKVDLASKKGILAINPSRGDNPIQFVEENTNGIGADGVIITASSKSDDIIHEACEMSRKRGRIVLIGVIGMNMRRDDFYKKELSFQVSCSYGAGRYDEEYENKGHDYPIAYVRWTEKRNFEAILFSISHKLLDVKSLITEEVDINDYNLIYGDMRKAGSIASIINFPDNAEITRVVKIINDNSFKAGAGKIGIIGAGNYTSSMVVPCLAKAGASIKYIASAQGLNAKILAKKSNAENATSDYKEILKDPEVSLAIITTRHNLHAKMIIEALNAHKNVFCEKPLCLNKNELNEIIDAYKNTSDVTLTVGFNRRFSPYAVKLKQLVGDGAKNIVATMNAGFIPPEMWVHDLEIGGGRIIGEACHFIDLCSYIAGSKVVSVCMNALGENPQENTDNVSILLKYENGTNAVINYFSNGSKSYAKERVEVFSQQKVFIIDNWRKLTGYGVKGFSNMKGGMDKGQKNQFSELNKRIINGGAPLIPFDSIINTTKASFAAIESLKENRWIDIVE